MGLWSKAIALAKISTHINLGFPKAVNYWSGEDWRPPGKSCLTPWTCSFFPLTPLPAYPIGAVMVARHLVVKVMAARTASGFLV